MATHTSLNMNLAVMDEIKYAAEISGKSRSKIIIMLLMKVLAHENHTTRRPGAVQYQERDSKDMWKPFHITFSYEEYEYFQDLKRLLKMSLSLAVAYAVKKYLNLILYGEDTDNYEFKGYKLSREKINDEIIWTISWGKPILIGKLIPKNTS